MGPMGQMGLMGIMGLMGKAQPSILNFQFSITHTLPQ
jgi:hypothetical protein